MTNSENQLALGQKLAKRLSPIATVIGCLISVGIPATYYGIESYSLKRTATIYAEEFADDLEEEVIIDNPSLWQYQAQKYLQVINRFVSNKDLVSVQVLDASGKPIPRYRFAQDKGKPVAGFQSLKKLFRPWFGHLSSPGSAPILFNNRRVGSIEIAVSQTDLLEVTLVLLLCSTAAGISLAMLVYRFPVKVVEGMEGQLQTLVEALQQSKTESESLQLAAQASEKRLRDLVQGLDAIVWEVDATNFRVLFISHRVEEVLGYPVEQWLTVPNFWLEHIHPEDQARIRAIYRVELLSQPEKVLEYRLIAADGRVISFRDQIQSITDEDGKPKLLRGVMVDITDRVLIEQQLLHNAFHDALTGLSNRALLMERLNHLLAVAERQQDCLFAVLFLDFDRFKVINDSLGHLNGDRLLVAIAERLQTHLRPGDTVARLGGDEFVVLVERLQTPDQATQVAQRIQADLAHPFNINGHEIFVTTSMGIALNTLPYHRAEDLLRDADTAMYHAKAQGKACYKVFDASMHSRAVTLLQLENDLRRAIERQEFQLHYQPIVSLETSKVIGFEALIRWQHPEKGLISPTAFIPVAEETGLIYAIGAWVLQTACEQMQIWNQCAAATCSPLIMSVNLSSKQFAHPDLVDKIRGILEETGLRARQLRIEITESVIMENAEDAIAMLEQLRCLGVQLAIDDFGTGYSSLGYLHRFPVSALKIDRSFVSPIGGVDAEDEQISISIVRTIVNLAHNIGMTVTAEGIETVDQLAALRELSCENGQGYLFSKPLNAQAAQAFIMAPLTQAA